MYGLTHAGLIMPARVDQTVIYSVDLYMIYTVDLSFIHFGVREKVAKPVVTSLTEIEHSCVRSENGYGTLQINDQINSLRCPSKGFKFWILCLGATCREGLN